MTEQRKRHFLIFLPVWIIPVLLILFGSLINFHQHRIWGEQLLPHSFVAPRDKAKIIKIQDVKNPVTDFILFSTQDETLPVVQSTFLPIVPASLGIGSRSLPIAGLRAPPLA